MLEDVDNAQATWLLRHGGRAVLRIEGKIVYDGAEAEMPDAIRLLTEDFIYPLEKEQPQCETS